jgi:hypothetical protein
LDEFLAALVPCIPIGFVVFLVARRVWGGAIAPRGDLLRIKRDLEGEGRRVARIERCEQVIELRWSGEPRFRKYRVFMEDAVSGDRVRIIGVEDRVLGDLSLRVY